jgi:hypothetical protein
MMGMVVGGGCGAWSESGSSLERRGERERERESKELGAT